VGLVIGPCPVPSRRRGRRPRHQAAAAAFGGYPRALALVDVPARVTICKAKTSAALAAYWSTSPPVNGRVQVSGTADPIPG